MIPIDWHRTLYGYRDETSIDSTDYFDKKGCVMDTDLTTAHSAGAEDSFVETYMNYCTPLYGYWPPLVFWNSVRAN